MPAVILRIEPPARPIAAARLAAAVLLLLLAAGCFPSYDLGRFEGGAQDGDVGDGRDGAVDTDGDADADGGADADGEADAEAEADADADADGGEDAGGDADADADGDADVGADADAGDVVVGPPARVWGELTGSGAPADPSGCAARGTGFCLRSDSADSAARELAGGGFRLRGIVVGGETP